MKHLAFAVHDCKASAFLTPFFFPTAGQAVRAFSDTVNDVKSMLARHPADYTLFQIGHFDDQTGQLESCKPINLGQALNFIEAQKPQADMFNFAKGA